MSIGLKLTESLTHFLCYHGYLKEWSLLGMGHIEVLTEEIWAKYMEWVKTDEGKTYLKGGVNYKEPR